MKKNNVAGQDFSIKTASLLHRSACFSSIIWSSDPVEKILQEVVVPGLKEITGKGGYFCHPLYLSSHTLPGRVNTHIGLVDLCLKPLVYQPLLPGTFAICLMIW